MHDVQKQRAAGKGNSMEIIRDIENYIKFLKEKPFQSIRWNLKASSVSRN